MTTALELTARQRQGISDALANAAVICNLHAERIANGAPMNEDFSEEVGEAYELLAGLMHY